MLKKLCRHLRAVYTVHKLNDLLNDVALLRAGARERARLAELAVQAALEKEAEAYAIMRELGVLRDGDPSTSASANETDNCF